MMAWVVRLLFFAVLLTGASARSSPAELPLEPLDLNVATVEQLDALPGVGRKRAEAIVSYRLQRPFRRVSELMRVKGIGRRLYVRIKPHVRVGTPLHKLAYEDPSASRSP